MLCEEAGGLYALAKSIASGQPAQSAQADMVRNFSLYLNFLYMKDNSTLRFKVALQILGRKFYKNTKKLPLYSQSLLIFIHKTPVVENHPTAGKQNLENYYDPCRHRRESRSIFTLAAHSCT